MYVLANDLFPKLPVENCFVSVRFPVVAGRRTWVFNQFKPYKPGAVTCTFDEIPMCGLPFCLPCVRAFLYSKALIVFLPGDCQETGFLEKNSPRSNLQPHCIAWFWYAKHGLGLSLLWPAGQHDHSAYHSHLALTLCLRRNGMRSVLDDKSVFSPARQTHN